MLVSFDLDGVLQRNPFHSSSPHGVFGHIKRELGPYAGHSDPEAAANAALEMVLAEHQRLMHSGLLVEAHDWDAILDTVITRLGYPGRLNVADLVTEYCEKPGLVWLYEGAQECLQQLTAAGHTLVTITNGFRCYQEPVLRKLGILAQFCAVITPEAVGAAKPQAPIFQAAEAFGGKGIHIGDTLPHDIAGAKRAGWRGIYVVQPGAPGYSELDPTLAPLLPWERPAKGTDWLRHRLDVDRRWHGHPPVTLEECIPDAIVTSLAEVPATVAALSSAPLT
ncbi:MAG TPA: HAD family hydrolase [Symbiobacteriaceae bacterium]|nr:HAD family hydrolase [Symbiobacteriaceae bacterium]